MGKSANKPVYLDFAATTPLSSQAKQAMEPYWQDQFYNPSALYWAAHETKQALETARSRISLWLGAQAHRLIFTSGATEANNLVIGSITGSYPRARILTSTIEHVSVRSPAASHNYREVKVDANGMVDLAALGSSLNDSVVLVSIIHASNELGTVQPVARIVKLLEQHRRERVQRGKKLPLLLHIDAAQSANCLDLHANRLGVDFMTLSAHKCYGPKGIGGLFVKQPHLLTPTQHGGGQERSLRSGTEALPLIIGFATAFERAQVSRVQTTKNLSAKREALLSSLRGIPGVRLNAADAKQALPNIINISVEGRDGERMVLELDRLGFQVATGAACSASSDAPSHVLAAIGLSPKAAQSSLRISFGITTTKRDLQRFARALAGLVGAAVQ